MPAGLLCRLCQFFFFLFFLSFFGGCRGGKNCKDFAFCQIPEHRKPSGDVFHRALHCVIPTNSVRSVAAGNDNDICHTHLIVYSLLSTPI